MKLITSLSRAAGLGLCVVAFTGTALADPGNGNGNAPATPPGQEKKADQAAPPAATPAPAPAPQAAAPGQEKKAENAPQPAAKKAAAKPAAKPVQAKSAKPATAPGQAKKAEKQAEHKPAKAASESKGQSANAHHHVIICHRTGSLSNPYVVLNIPWTAWTHGHTTHPAKNGNADKILKDPASRPGSKDGFTKADCGAPAAPSTTRVTPPATQETGNCPTSVTTTEQVLVGIWHATGAYNKDGTRKYVLISPSMKSAHWDKHADDKPAYETRTVTRTFSGENCATVTSTSNTSNTSSPSSTSNVSGTANTQSGAEVAPVGGVAGAVSPTVKKPNAKPAGGVLGAIASAPEAIADTAATGNLPFTGFPLWIAALIAVALLAAGLMLRRRTAA